MSVRGHGRGEGEGERQSRGKMGNIRTDHKYFGSNVVRYLAEENNDSEPQKPLPRVTISANRKFLVVICTDSLSVSSHAAVGAGGAVGRWWAVVAGG